MDVVLIRVRASSDNINRLHPMYYMYNYKTIVIEKKIVVSYLSVCVQVCQLYSIRDLHTTQILSGTITFSLPSQY